MNLVNEIWYEGLVEAAKKILKPENRTLGLEAVARPVWGETIEKMIREEGKNNAPEQMEKILKMWREKSPEEKEKEFDNSDRSFREFIKQIKSHSLMAQISKAPLN
ncbi:MAG: hypothetical protein PHD51_04015 [Patescibacteria group bacterium]|nr:hypothetical protein [Patescibacteria group bacterium]MDD5490870.1 hypothetical protein [Patescibacteria group bacterium]